MPSGAHCEFYTDNAGFTADEVAEAAVQTRCTAVDYTSCWAAKHWYWRMKRFMPQTFLNLIASKYNKWINSPRSI